MEVSVKIPQKRYHLSQILMLWFSNKDMTG